MTTTPVITTTTPFRVVENAANGTSIGTVTYREQDVDQTVTFQIVETTTTERRLLNDVVTIDAVRTGELLVRDPSVLDFESLLSVTIGVVIADDGVPSLQTRRELVVRLVDMSVYDQWARTQVE